MNSRRKFIKDSVLLLTATALAPSALAFDKVYTSNRPKPSERKFTSKAVEETIVAVKKKIKDPELAWLFENCYPNTLDTTVSFTDGKKPDTFVITGDIDAMWLRDSTAQVWPYLPEMEKDVLLKKMVAGLINRQTKCILIDPYANAFNKEPGESHWKSDHTEMKPELHERKWEIDSLCYAIRLAYHYWKRTSDTSCFDADWYTAMEKVVQTFRTQQRKKSRGPYRFTRTTAWQTDTVAGNGYGNPIRPVGLIVSIFRPSDDATTFPFLIPSNYFARTSLYQLAEILVQIKAKSDPLSKDCIALADELTEALQTYARAKRPNHPIILPYEVDGFGNRMLMDDANVPSLLSMPYLGLIESKDPLYQQTRAFLLSSDNPYFFKGKAAEGIGSPHTLINNIWPMGIIMRAMTSEEDTEITKCLEMLKTTHANTGFMHESFDKDDASKFTRSWFAWANTLFGELILKILKERPHLLQ